VRCVIVCGRFKLECPKCPSAVESINGLWVNCLTNQNKNAGTTFTYNNLDGSHKHKTEQKDTSSWVPVAHACNPSYSGGRDHED
jgi:hypothetical protein